jgi:hypothetical protein
MGMNLQQRVEALQSGQTTRVQLFRETFDDAHAAWEQAYTAKLAGKISKADYFKAWATRQYARANWLQAKGQQ